MASGGAAGERRDARAGRRGDDPARTAFQFRAEGGEPLAFVAVTMPPWPGMDEAFAVEGPWTPTVAAGR